MSKKEICMNNQTIGYWSACGGVEVKKIEYDVNDYIYCVSNAWNTIYGSNTKGYHKLKINYSNDDAYIRLHGYKLSLSECMRTAR